MQCVYFEEFRETLRENVLKLAKSNSFSEILGLFFSGTTEGKNLTSTKVLDKSNVDTKGIDNVHAVSLNHNANIQRSRQAQL